MTSLAIALSALQLTVDAPPPGGAGPIPLRGKWVLDADGKAVGPKDFRRGLQTSGLLFRKGELWSIGDQRSEYPGHLFRIDPKTARLVGKPVRLELPEKREGENPDFEVYRGIPNSDFEGITLDPKDSNHILAVTEDKVSWVADVSLEGAEPGAAAPGARIRELTRIQFPEGLTAWGTKPNNYRFEGCAVSDDGATVYLAFERADDGLPRLFQMTMEAARSGKPASIRDVPIPFAKIPRRASLPKALLNWNDIQFLRVDGRPCLVSILRDQERLLLVDLERRECSRTIDLDLLDPAGTQVFWVSPEGLAVDPATDRLWIINDPDSEQGNYRARAEAAATREFAEFTPLLFELPLSTLTRK